MPPEAFSPLTTTKSSACSSRSPGSSSRSARRPAEATMSPTKRMAATRCTVPVRPPWGSYWRAMSGPEVDTEEQVPEAVEEAPIPLAPPVPEPPADVAPVVVPRWIQLVVLPLALLGLWAVARAAGPVLLLFIVAGLIALLLNPFVTLLRRGRFPRGAAVGTVFLVLVLSLTGLGILLADPVANQVSGFRDSVPGLVDDANASLSDFQGWLDRNGIDLQVSKPGQTAVESLGDRIAEGSGELATFTRDALLRIAEGSIAVILIIVLS